MDGDESTVRTAAIRKISLFVFWKKEKNMRPNLTRGSQPFCVCVPLNINYVPYWYKCTQVNTTWRPLTSPQVDASPLVGNPWSTLVIPNYFFFKCSITRLVFFKGPGYPGDSNSQKDQQSLWICKYFYTFTIKKLSWK